jgi:enediyne biosynthesis protein E4
MSHKTSDITILRILFLSVLLSLPAFNCPGVPVITKQPSPQTNSVSLGMFLTNRISATTTNPPLGYQWQLNAVPLTSATNASLALTNIQTTNSGSYVVTVTDGDSSVSSSPWVVDVDPTFTKITSDPVVGTYAGQGGSGAAWVDYNNDGQIDLFISMIQGPNLLFTNNGNGTFSRATTGSVVSTGSTYSAGGVWGDYDNDGLPDLFVSVNGNSPNNDLLYHNNGNGIFTQISTGSIVSSGGKGNSCAWGDYDNDGYLDLYVCNSDQNNFLFHNNGNGTFTRITTGPLVTATGNSQGCAWGDYDNDGYLDLFVTRSGGNNLLFHNNQNGTFTRISSGPMVSDSSGGACAWGDYDNDGYLDLFATSTRGLLYHNNGDGTFTKITNGPMVTDVIGFNGGCAWADYDNDGYLDLFISVIGSQNLFYHNNGDGTFSKVTSGSIVTDGNAIACAWGDFDNNGFPDLFTTGAGVPSHLYRNNGNTNNWLNIKCLGRVSNRSSIGTKVRIKATIHGLPIWQTREISGGGGLGSQNDFRCEFGLGDAMNADVVRVEWPSGIVQELTNVAAKQFLTVKEPSKLAADFSPASGEFHVALTGGKGLVYTLESSTDLASWTSSASLTNQTGMVIWTNQLSISAPALLFRSREE